MEMFLSCAGREDPLWVDANCGNAVCVCGVSVVWAAALAWMSVLGLVLASVGVWALVQESALVLCYAMLCYATLRYATLCFALLCSALFCFTMPCNAMPCSVVLSHAMRCDEIRISACEVLNFQSVLLLIP